MKVKIFLKVIVFSCIAAFLSCLSGCESLEMFNCPYIIANPRVVLGENEGEHSFAGTYFNLFNDSSKTITDVTVSFLLYDGEGENPFIGSNCVVSKINCVIGASQQAELVVSLDSYISVVPSEPYKIDFMYLREIKYSDGSSWSDPFGMYAVKEVYQ